MGAGSSDSCSLHNHPIRDSAPRGLASGELRGICEPHSRRLATCETHLGPEHTLSNSQNCGAGLKLTVIINESLDMIAACTPNHVSFCPIKVGYHIGCKQLYPCIRCTPLFAHCCNFLYTWATQTRGRLGIFIIASPKSQTL